MGRSLYPHSPIHSLPTTRHQAQCQKGASLPASGHQAQRRTRRRRAEWLQAAWGSCAAASRRPCASTFCLQAAYGRAKKRLRQDSMGTCILPTSSMAEHALHHQAPIPVLAGSRSWVGAAWNIMYRVWLERVRMRGSSKVAAKGLVCCSGHQRACVPQWASEGLCAAVGF